MASHLKGKNISLFTNVSLVWEVSTFLKSLQWILVYQQSYSLWKYLDDQVMEQWQGSCTWMDFRISSKFKFTAQLAYFTVSIRFILNVYLWSKAGCEGEWSWPHTAEAEIFRFLQRKPCVRIFTISEIITMNLKYTNNHIHYGNISRTNWWNSDKIAAHEWVLGSPANLVYSAAGLLYFIGSFSLKRVRME